jgi:hypothetical protein
MELLRKYAKALMKGADAVTSGPRERGKGLRSEFFLRMGIERFNDRSSVLLVVDVHRSVPGLVRQEMQAQLVSVRDEINVMLDALAKVKE